MGTYKISALSPLKFHRVGVGDFAYNNIPYFEYSKGYKQIYLHGDAPVIQVIASTSDAVMTLSFIDNTGAAVGIYKQILGAPVATYEGSSVYQFDVPIFPTSVGPDGVYFAKIIISDAGGSLTLYSEPLYILTTLPDGVCTIIYDHDTNDFDRNFTDAAALPSMLRIEGGMKSDGFQPGGKFTAFQDQDYKTVMLSADPVDVEKWTFGPSEGAPNWIGGLLSRIFALSDVKIDGVQYSRHEGAKVERIGETEYPLAGWSIDLVKTENPYSDEFGTSTMALTVDTTSITSDDSITVDTTIL